MTPRWTVPAILLAATLAGCSVPEPGTTRSMGSVSYEQAFVAAKEVLSQHFSIITADPASGVITTRPKPVEPGAERLLGRSPTRQLATMRIRKKDEQVAVHLAVAVQSEGSDIFRGEPGAESYDAVPNRTPAEREGATSPEQNQVWETRSYAHGLEARILDEIHSVLHPSQN